MGYRAFTGHAEVDVDNIRAFGLCDRCKQLHNHDQLTWQYDYRGSSLQNLRILVCPDCLDIPNPSFKTIVLPPDPVPVMNARPDDPLGILSVRQTEDGQTRTTEDDQTRVDESSVSN